MYVASFFPLSSTPAFSFWKTSFLVLSFMVFFLQMSVSNTSNKSIFPVPPGLHEGYSFRKQVTPLSLLPETHMVQDAVMGRQLWISELSPLLFSWPSITLLYYLEGLALEHHKHFKGEVVNGSKTECAKWDTGSYGRLAQCVSKTRGAGSIKTWWTSLWSSHFMSGTGCGVCSSANACWGAMTSSSIATVETHQGPNL